MNCPDTTPLAVMSASGQGDTPPLGTVVESIVCLNTELEMAIRYPQPRRLTATAIAECQRTSVLYLISISAKNVTHLATRSD
jgi:hypothetical protein